MSITENKSKYMLNIVKQIAYDRKRKIYRIYDKNEESTNWLNMGDLS